MTTNPNARVQFIQKYAPEIDVETGELLSHTDIDFIIDDGTNLVYYQAKSTAGSFGSLNEVQNWVIKARFDAQANGITNQLIRFVTPDPNVVDSAIQTALQNQGILILQSPLLR